MINYFFFPESYNGADLTSIKSSVDGLNEAMVKKDKNEFSRVFMDIVENADVAQNIVDKHYPNLKEVCIRFGLFQRLDYMLHIPVGQMNSQNEFYAKVKTYLRSHWKDTISNVYLTKKNKIYLLLLTIAPKTVRFLHQKVRGL